MTAPTTSPPRGGSAPSTLRLTLRWTSHDVAPTARAMLHEGPVGKWFRSADGRSVCSFVKASRPAIYLWDAERAALRQQLELEWDEYLLDASYAADGERVAIAVGCTTVPSVEDMVAGREKTRQRVMLVEVKTGRVLRTLEPPGKPMLGGRVGSVALAPDGNKVAYTSGFGDVLHLHDAATGARLAERPSSGHTSGLCWSTPERIVLWSRDTITTFDAELQKTGARSWAEGDDDLDSMLYLLEPSASGSHLAVVWGSGRGRLLEASDLTNVGEASFSLQPKTGYRVHWRGDSAFVLRSGADGVLEPDHAEGWDRADLGEVPRDYAVIDRTLVPLTDRDAPGIRVPKVVEGLRFSRDHQTLHALAGGEFVDLDAQDGSARARTALDLGVPADHVRAPQRFHMLASSDVVLDTGAGALLWRAAGPAVVRIAESGRVVGTDGERLVAIADDGGLRVLDVEAVGTTLEVAVKGQAIACAVSKDLGVVCAVEHGAGGGPEERKSWTLEALDPARQGVKRFETELDIPWTWLSFSRGPHGTQLTGFCRNDTRLESRGPSGRGLVHGLLVGAGLKGSDQKGTMTTPTPILAVAVDPGGTRVAILERSCVLTVGTLDPSPTYSSQLPGGIPRCVAWSPSGDAVAVGTLDGVVSVYDVR